MSDSSRSSVDPAEPSSANVSGGVEASAQGDIKVNGSVVGRDSITNSGINIVQNIEHYHANEPAPPAVPPVDSAPPLSPPGPPSSLKRVEGSPFAPGRPLRAEEPIFGREDAFHFIAQQLAKFSSVNIVGERRMGKSSLLSHLLGRQADYLQPQNDQPPLVLAHVDLQAQVINEARFYGTALRELLDRLPASRSAEARNLQSLRERLHSRPEATYDEFEHALKLLRDERGICVRPVVVVDEFEQLLEPALKPGFPYPQFYNGLRALITAELLALVLASRKPLVEHFAEQPPGSLTSTFPSYLVPFTLQPLSNEAADALLLQPSDHTLAIPEVTQARQWAGEHPCLLQAAGEAWYEAKDQQRSAEWAAQRFQEIKQQSCSTGRAVPQAAAPEKIKRPNGIKRLARAIFISLPMRVGRLAKWVGNKQDAVTAWIIGAIIIIVVLLALFGLLSTTQLVDSIKNLLGIS
jgi:uncharacterized protein